MKAEELQDPRDQAHALREEARHRVRTYREKWTQPREIPANRIRNHPRWQEKLEKDV